MSWDKLKIVCTEEWHESVPVTVRVMNRINGVWLPIANGAGRDQRVIDDQEVSDAGEVRASDWGNQLAGSRNRQVTQCECGAEVILTDDKANLIFDKLVDGGVPRIDIARLNGLVSNWA